MADYKWSLDIYGSDTYIDYDKINCETDLTNLSGEAKVTLNIRGARYKYDGYSSSERAGNVKVSARNKDKTFTIETRAYNPTSEKSTIDSIWNILNYKYHYLHTTDYFNKESIHSADHALAVAISSVDYGEGVLQINGYWCDTFKITVKRAI